MHTRFDNTSVWITADHRVISIKDMETTHILNTLRMLICKPHTTMSMLITDIEKSVEDATLEPWYPSAKDRKKCKKKSLSNATSMKPEEIIAYVIESPLCSAMLKELRNRGVNTDNMLSIWYAEATMNICVPIYKEEK